LALLQTLKGRLQFTPQALANLTSGSSAAQPPLTASCPQCGRTIQLEHEISRDQQAYAASWFCDGCGFHSEATNIQAPGIFTHSEGYKWICWRGTNYELTPNQAEIVKILHARYLRGTPDIHERELMRELRVPDSRLRDSFRSANSQLLGTLIIRKPGGPRGIWRLKL
jgi:predicted RNA-binding Zn-ribbon protein involved in translation (DUF1610 family)